MQEKAASKPEVSYGKNSKSDVAEIFAFIELSEDVDCAESAKEASIEFGVVDVSQGENLFVDVMVQSMTVSIIGGNDAFQGIVENIGEVIAHALLYQDCTALDLDLL
jgi:hypothetical protein